MTAECCCLSVFCHAEPVVSDSICCRWSVPSRQWIHYGWCTHRQSLPQGNAHILLLFSDHVPVQFNSF